MPDDFFVGGLIDFCGVKITHLENESMSPEKEPFQKNRIVFQPAFFRGELLVFGGVHWAVAKTLV